MSTASSGSPNMTGRKGSDMSNSSQEVSYFRQLEKRMKYREKYAKVGEKREREAQSAREKINQLQMENEELKSIIERDKYRSTMIEHLIHSKLNKLNEDSSSDEVDVAVKTYSELYAEHGTCNRNEICFHLNRLKAVQGSPTHSTMMWLFMLIQPNSFFRFSTSPVFESLSVELGLTRDQVSLLRSRRDKILNVLGQYYSLSLAMEEASLVFQRMHEKYASIAQIFKDANVSSSQILQFILWFQENRDVISKLAPGDGIDTPPNFAFADAETKKFLRDMMNECAVSGSTPS